MVPAVKGGYGLIFCFAYPLQSSKNVFITCIYMSCNILYFTLFYSVHGRNYQLDTAKVLLMQRELYKGPHVGCLVIIQEMAR